MAARRNTLLLTALAHLASIVLLTLAIIGNTHISSPILTSIYFFKLDVSHIIPVSADNSFLLNSVARSLGLHDFYQVGLWNFCEGYLDTGVVRCSPPRAFYWFNPVDVLVSELLAGAKIALPSEAVTVLHLLRVGQQLTYAFFMAGVAIAAVTLLLTGFAGARRWFSAVLAFLAAVSALLVVVAAAIASVISIAAKVALTAQDQLNIRVEVGVKMFVFMWAGAVLAVIAFVLQAAMGCCCLPEKKGGDGHEHSISSSTGVREKSRFSVASFARRRNRLS